ncbi:hypothetical protein HU200_011238 [Digitaria exilis]|uniref:Late embryogenesis abundant protein LEA-2 subgroup domain-containing protein n=1 Tax=Digitaria exilis TaxID=1010633 RepID=A0A835FHI4_9POAL|nr:hypothetical protein HU200_011238 [Digitaria exilis]
MAAAQGGRDGRHVTLLVPPDDRGQPQQVAQHPREGRNGGGPQQPAAAPPRPRPSYTPPSQRRREQPPPAYGPSSSYPQGGSSSIPDQGQQAMPPPGGAPPPGARTESVLAMPDGAAPPRRKPRFGAPATTTWAPGLVTDPSDARQHRRPGGDDDEALAPAGILTAPGAAAPLPRGVAAPPRRKRFGIATTTWASDLPDTSDARRPGPRQHMPPARPGDEAAAPPRGGSPTAPGGPRRFGLGGLPTAKTIERSPPPYQQPSPYGKTTKWPAPVPPHGAYHQQPPSSPYDPYQQQPSSYGKTKTKRQQPSPMYPTERWKRKENSRKPLQVLFTLCCILFWLLVVCIGLAILVIYLLYHPKPPKLHVSTATLNAGYIDELPPPRLGDLALNSDLYVLAAIYNPNTKIDVAVHYMQFDLYFQGHLVGTQAAWPPLFERPGDSALRTVHLVVSEVMLSPEDAGVWRNVTESGGLVQMQLEGRFYVQLNFGRWLPFRYMVKPSCALWLDPPPAGALRRARCRQ